MSASPSHPRPSFQNAAAPVVLGDDTLLSPTESGQPGRILALPRWVFFAIIALVFWSLWGLSFKLVSKDVSPYALVMISTLGMIPGTLVIATSSRLGHGSRRWSCFLFGAAAGLCGQVGDFLLFKAMLSGGFAAIVIPLTGMFPLLTVILAFIVFRERLNKFQILGIIGSLVALGLFNIGGTDDTGVARGWYETLCSGWMLYSLGAFCLFGLAGIPQKLATRYGSNELATVAFTTASVAVSLVLLVTTTTNWHGISRSDWIFCLLIGALSIGGLMATFAAYRWGKLSLVTALTSLYPALTSLLAIVLLGERVTLVIVAAIVLAKVAGALMSMETPMPKTEARPAGIPPLI